MIERIVENWLIKANEKSFQIPFCQMLTGEGYKVVHLTRHGSFEEGKDIIAIDPDGTPCAFQLKGSDSGKITQKEWAKYIDQVNRLVEIPIKHPSIDETKSRRVYFVTNGELDEEVRVEIAGRNSDWRRRQHPELIPIVKGEMLTRFMIIQSDLWPDQLTSEKELLELFLANGYGYLDKSKLAHFLENLLLNPEAATKAEGPRNLASAAIFTSYALSPFTQAENYVAIIEGWMVFLSCLIAYSEKFSLNEKYWKDSAYIAEEAIKIAVSDLVEEMKDRKNFIAGNALVDAPFYRGRLTWLMSFVSLFVLWQRQSNPEWKPTEWISSFLVANQKSLLFWGEVATPQILAVAWALRSIGLPFNSDRLLFEMLKGIIDRNITNAGLPDPYHPLGEIVLNETGLSDKQHEENFKGRSYSLDALIQLLAKRDFRGVLGENWKQITSLQFVEFQPEKAWQYCLWNCEDGLLNTTIPLAPQSWQDLVKKANSYNLDKIPLYFRNNPVLFLFFLVVYPHRLTPDGAKFIDETLKSIAIN